MENQQVSIRTYFNSDAVKAKFTELLGQKAQGFLTSVLQVVASNDLLSKADPVSVYQAAAIAATLDLPINNNLGFAYIVPYYDRKLQCNVAQFQMGHKGFLQLALRSGQFDRINTIDVREGEIEFYDRLTGDIKFNWIQDNNRRNQKPIIAYVAYFRLLNGFEKTHLMYMDEMQQHGMKYSQTYKKGFGLWKDDFNAMAKKTVLKLLLAKYAPLSIEMHKAIVSDQAVIKNAETEEVNYIDNSDHSEDRKVISLNLKNAYSND